MINFCSIKSVQVFLSCIVLRLVFKTTNLKKAINIIWFIIRKIENYPK